MEHFHVLNSSASVINTEEILTNKHQKHVKRKEKKKNQMLINKA